MGNNKAEQNWIMNGVEQKWIGERNGAGVAGSENQ